MSNHLARECATAFVVEVASFPGRADDVLVKDRSALSGASGIALAEIGTDIGGSSIELIRN